MNETTHISLIAMAPTPTTTTTQPVTQQTDSASTGMPGWLSVEVPLLDAVLTGGVLVAVIGGWFQLRIREKDRQHAMELERIKAEYENKKEKRAHERQQINKWRELIQKNFEQAMFSHPDFTSFFGHMSGDDLNEFIKSMATIELEYRKEKPDDELICQKLASMRYSVGREIARVEKEWDLI
jgi:uncharacterized protein HemX